MSDSKELTTEISKCIQQNPVVLFTSNTQCLYCEKALHFLSTNCIPFYEYVLDFEGPDYTDLVALSSQTTVPNIFVNGMHVGGYDKLVDFYNNGYLISDFCFSGDF